MSAHISLPVVTFEMEIEAACVEKTHCDEPRRRSKGDLSEGGKHPSVMRSDSSDLTAEQFAGLEVNKDVESLDQHSSLMLLVVTQTD